MSNSSQTQLIIPCRLSWCFVATPNLYEGEDETDGPAKKPEWKYIVQALMPQTDKVTAAKIHRAEKYAIAGKFGKDKIQRCLNNPNFKRPLRDAVKEQKEHPKYSGMNFMNCNVKATGEFDYSKKAIPAQIQNGTASKYCNRPGVILKNRTVLKRVQDIEKEIYAGCYVYVSLTSFAYHIKAKGAVGVTMILNNILKDKDGERLDFTKNPLTDFADLLDDEPLENEFDDLLGTDPSKKAQVEDDDPLGLNDDDPLGENDPLADDPPDDDVPF